MCGINVESISNLLFGCKVAAHVWKMCDLWVGLSSVHHNIATSHFIQFELQGMNKLQQIVAVYVGGHYMVHLESKKQYHL